MIILSEVTTLIGNGIVNRRLIENGAASDAPTVSVPTKEQDEKYAKMMQMLKKPVKLFPLRKPRKGDVPCCLAVLWMTILSRASSL